jgi:glycosyltransferase involved in cell wall biosynthesis
MRVAIVHNFYREPGGEDAVVRQETEALKKNGQQVSSFSVYNDDIKGIISTLWTGLSVTYNPIARWQLDVFLRKVRPDVVHVHNFFPQLSPSVFYACKALNIPSVMTLHNFRVLCPTCFLYHDGHIRERSLDHSCLWTIRRKTYRNSLVGTAAVAAMVEVHKLVKTWSWAVDRYIALTSFARNKFIRGGLPADRIVVKGNATSPINTSKSGSTRHGALFVGRLSEEKGISVLLNAWRNVDYPLTIIGKGPLQRKVLDASGTNIRYLGYLSSEGVRAQMLEASFLVLPSVWYEMFPMTAVEAFGCALPVLCSDAPGLSEIIVDHLNGVQFRRNDTCSLAETVQWASSHPNEMREYGTNAYRTHAQKYTPEINYDALMKIYADLISARRENLVGQGSRLRWWSVSRPSVKG